MLIPTAEGAVRGVRVGGGRSWTGRPAGPMCEADIAVTDRLQDAVCAVVNGEDPDWSAWNGRNRPAAVFGEH